VEKPIAGFQKEFKERTEKGEDVIGSIKESFALDNFKKGFTIKGIKKWFKPK